MPKFVPLESIPPKGDPATDAARASVEFSELIRMLKSPEAVTRGIEINPHALGFHDQKNPAESGRQFLNKEFAVRQLPFKALQRRGKTYVRFHKRTEIA